MKTSRALIAFACLASGTAHAQVAELRELFRRELAPADVSRLIEIAEKGDAESRLQLWANADRLGPALNSVEQIEVGDHLGRLFAEDLKGRKSTVERRVVLRAGVKAIGATVLPTWSPDFYCGTFSRTAIYSFQDQVRIALRKYPIDLSQLMKEDCLQACNIALFVFRGIDDGRASAGLAPWLISADQDEWIGAAVSLVNVASKPEDGRLLKPILEKVDIVIVDLLRFQLRGRDKLDKVYPKFEDMPKPLQHVHILRQPESGLPIPSAAAKLKFVRERQKEGNIVGAPLADFQLLADSPGVALEGYRILREELESETTPFLFKADPALIEGYFPLIDEMLQSKNWAIRTTAGRIAMQSLDRDRSTNKAVAERYVMRLLKDPHPEVRATTRAAVTVVTGALRDEIRRVLTKDGVDLPPP